jgi:hypothetical protein
MLEKKRKETVPEKSYFRRPGNAADSPLVEVASSDRQPQPSQGPVDTKLILQDRSCNLHGAHPVNVSDSSNCAACSNKWSVSDTV